MNDKPKGDARSFLKVLKKVIVKFLLLSAGAASIGALYAGLCGAVLGLAHGGWWAAWLGCGQRGALAGLAAGVLTATFGGASLRQLVSSRETSLPTLLRGTLRVDAVREMERRPSLQSATRLVQNASPAVNAVQKAGSPSANYIIS